MLFLLLYSLSLSLLHYIIPCFSQSDRCLYTRVSPRDITPPSKPSSKPVTHVPLKRFLKSTRSFSHICEPADHGCQVSRREASNREKGTWEPLFCRCET